jgi:hypothetical protein
MHGLRKIVRGRKIQNEALPPTRQPLVIPNVMTLATLSDVRELMRHLPEEHRNRSTWRHVAAELDKAAGGADVAEVAIALRIVLMLEHVEYLPR